MGRFKMLRRPQVDCRLSVAARLRLRSQPRLLVAVNVCKWSEARALTDHVQHPFFSGRHVYSGTDMVFCSPRTTSAFQYSFSASKTGHGWLKNLGRCH